MSKNDADSETLRELLRPLWKKTEAHHRLMEFAEKWPAREPDKADRQELEQTQQSLNEIYKAEGRRPPVLSSQVPEDVTPDYTEFAEEIDEVVPALEKGWPKLAARLIAYRREIEDQGETGECDFDPAKLRLSLKDMMGIADDEEPPEESAEIPRELLVEIKGWKQTKLIEYLWEHPIARFSELHSSVWKDNPVTDRAIQLAVERLQTTLLGIRDVITQLGYSIKVENSGEFVRLHRQRTQDKNK